MCQSQQDRQRINHQSPATYKLVHLGSGGQDTPLKAPDLPGSGGQGLAVAVLSAGAGARARAKSLEMTEFELVMVLHIRCSSPPP